MPRLQAILLLLAPLLLGLMGGCAAPAEPAPLPASHPANAGATEAELPSRSQTLWTGAAKPSPPARQEAAAVHGAHAGHDGGGGTGMSEAPATSGPAATTTQALYACPMHPQVTSAQPGKCPKCGMYLVPAGEGR